MKSYEGMNERKLNILKAIIDDYINTAEPVGSRTIARRYELGLSSATIRNEMADLEEMGYLAQPYTSAGRIPSVKGYRLYVDHLLQLTEITIDEIIELRKQLATRVNELNYLMRQMASMLSVATGYTSMTAIPKVDYSKLKAVQIVPVGADTLLVIAVAEGGIVRNNLIKIPERLSTEHIIRISNILNRKLTGLSMNDININLIRNIKEEVMLNDSVLIPILEAVSDCISMIDKSEAHVDGAVNLLEQPEFNDPKKAKELFSFLEKDKNILKLLCNDAGGTDGIIINIGSENSLEEARDCTVVSTTCHIGGNMFSSIGVIGPIRMDYGRVISVMRLARKLFRSERFRLFGDDYDDIDNDYEKYHEGV